MLQGLVSIHDVMPDTREVISELLQEIQARVPRLTCDRITLLIVPGKDWRTSDLRWLDYLVDQGYSLAGHGWNHQAPHPKNLHHQLHSLLISRDAAEHLSRSASEIEQRMEACFKWFGCQGYAAPELYVPPAWAIGTLALPQIQSPFRFLESLWGLTDLKHNTYTRLPLCGFEADTFPRACFLKVFNHWNLKKAYADSSPLRIALHPKDLHGLLRESIFRYLNAISQFEDYSISILPKASAGQSATR